MSLRLAGIVLAAALPCLMSREPRGTAADALEQGKFTTAVYLLKQAVAVAPTNAPAWTDLCRAYIALDQLDEATKACRKAIEVSDQQYLPAWHELGRAFAQQDKIDEAITAFQRSLDPRSHGFLGEIYYQLHRYSDAIAELEKADEVEPRNVVARINLAGAYLGAGQTSKGLGLLHQTVQEHPSPLSWNNAAFVLAAHGLELDRAQQYVESALSQEVSVMRSIDLDHIAVATLRHAGAIGVDWDTLGWISFQHGDLDQAEKFLNASWQLTRNGAVANHLGRLSEKRGQKPEAIRMYALALAAGKASPDTRSRLAALVADENAIDSLVKQAGEQLAQAGTVTAGKLLANRATAEFYIALTPASSEARFISGDESLRSAAGGLAHITSDGLFPDSAIPKLVRRARVTCPGGGGCSIEFASSRAAVAAALNAERMDTDFIRRGPEVHQIGSGVMAPSAIALVEPQISEEARHAGLQGTVVLAIVVDTTGRVSNIRVVRGLGMGLDEKAIEAVKQWLFRPGMKDGHPVKVSATIEVNFRLTDHPK